MCLVATVLNALINRPNGLQFTNAVAGAVPEQPLRVLTVGPDKIRGNDDFFQPGGGGGNRTPVRKSSTAESTCLPGFTCSPGWKLKPVNRRPDALHEKFLAGSPEGERTFEDSANVTPFPTPRRK